METKQCAMKKLWVIENSKRIIRKYLQTNENGNTTMAKKNDKEEFKTDTTELQRIVAEYYGQLKKKLVNS